MTFIPAGLYRQIVDTMPILCVDAIIANGQGEYLLVKRANEPLKGEWWVPGGRVLKGETLENAIQRKIREELGIGISVTGAAGYYEDQFEKNPLNVASGLHTLGIVFYAKALDWNIRLDGQGAAWGFFKQLPARLLIKRFIP